MQHKIQESKTPDSQPSHIGKVWLFTSVYDNNLLYSSFAIQASNSLILRIRLQLLELSILPSEYLQCLGTSGLITITL